MINSKEDIDMVKLNELNRLVGLCNKVGCSEGAKQFNAIRGRALGRSYCDFTYECEQVVEELTQKSYPSLFISELNSIIHNK